MAKDTWAEITDRMTALYPLHKRMDLTKEMAYMADFKLMTFDGKKKLDNVINVTGNKGASYAHRIVASLMNPRWQTVVEGDLTQSQAHDIELFLDDLLDETDIYVTENYGIPDLYSWLCNHVCVRGPIGVEWVSWMEKEEYKIHCNPVDMRWTPYVLNKWVAPISYPSAADLEVMVEEYEKKAMAGLGEYTKFTVASSKNDYQVRNFWDGEKNEVLIDKKLVYAQKHILKKPPFVIVFPPAGFMLRDKGYIEHEGEDIFFLIRKLNSELNRSLSIEQTIGMDILYPPLEYETDKFDAGPPRPAPKTGEVKKVPTGELHKPVPRGDLNKASQAARQDMMSMFEQGAPSQPAAYTQPPSALLVATEMEILEQFQNSRVTALKMFRAQLYRMMIDQFILIDGSASIGRRGKKRQYSAGQLKDPESYTISCQLMTKNKRLEIVNEARAMALWGRAPLKYILRDVLMVDDPDGWMREMDLEKAKEADPAISLYVMAMQYAKQATEASDEKEINSLNYQSKLLTERGVSIIKQRMQPAQPQLPEKATVPQTEQSSQAVVNLPSVLGTQGR